MHVEPRKELDAIDAWAERTFKARTCRRHADQRDTYGKEAFEKLFERKPAQNKKLH